MSVVSSRLTLTSFVPRQVMLETATHAAAVSSKDYNHKRKNKRNDENVTVMEVEDEGKKTKKKKSYKISNAVEDAFGTVKTQAFDRPSGDAISSKGKGREDLLRSIAAFLEGSGFVKTLSVFRSEARIEVNSREDACINLEDLFNKITESSRRDPVASLEWLKEQDVQTKDQRRKNKQVSDSFGLENSEKNLLDATLRTEENIDYGKRLEGENKNKRKAILAENMGEVALLNVEEVVTKEKIEKLKDLASGNFEKDKGDKKKKKKKEAKLFLEQSELGVNQKVIAMKPDDGGAYASTKHQESANSVNLAIDLPENVDGSRKDKKKNKNKKLEKSASDSLHTQNSDKLVEETSAGVAKHDDDDLKKSGFIKESIAISNENTADVGTTSNKKRQRSSFKETTIQLEKTTETSKLKQTKPEVDKEGKEACESDHKVLTCSELSPLNQKSKESLSTVVLDKHEEDSTLQDPLKQLSGHQLENGDLEKHQKEGSAKPKSMKKEKHSVEPKGVNAFQRVKVDQVQFADERLQDNSYWALDDSGSGYGAKAQEVLGQVRGRDFRHEKTKKKRGTYRGGQINLQSNSIKFNYSDDE